MENYRPSILAISLGGTLFMTSGDDKVAQKKGDNYDLSSDFPQIHDECIPFFKEISAIDSSNLYSQDWKKVAEYIIKVKDKYDGFVVLQGTDTLSYSASALSFALQGLGKPVVLTGAQISIGEAGSDAHNNVTNAFLTASSKHNKDDDRLLLQEVVVFFGSKIICGTRARKYSERDLEAFDTVNVPLVGVRGLEIQFNRNMVRKVSKPSESFGTSFDKNINMIHLYPGISPELVLDVGRKSSGLVLAAFGAGNIPSNEDNRPDNPLSLEKVITTLTEENIPVVITTQCVTGQAEFGVYKTGTAAIKAGAITVNDMTPETAYVKLSWVLANQENWPKNARRAVRGGPGWLEGVRKAMITDMAGEITENTNFKSVWM